MRHLGRQVGTTLVVATWVGKFIISDEPLDGPDRRPGIFTTLINFK